jgi:hypothetical protein
LQVKILPQKEPSGTGHVSLIVASSSIPQATPCRCRATSVVPHHQTDVTQGVEVLATAAQAFSAQARIDQCPRDILRIDGMQ